MADIVALVLRTLHILFGIAWVGAMMYGVAVLRRVLPRIEMPARKETMRRLIPVISQYIPGSAVMTITFGVLLYVWMGLQFGAQSFTGTNWGRILLSALVLALVTFGVGLAVGLRSAKGILAHLNEESCTHGPEMGALQKRFNAANVAALVLGLVIIGLMVVATTKAV